MSESHWSKQVGAAGSVGGMAMITVKTDALYNMVAEIQRVNDRIAVALAFIKAREIENPYYPEPIEELAEDRPKHDPYNAKAMWKQPKNGRYPRNYVGHNR